MLSRCAARSVSPKLSASRHLSGYCYEPNGWAPGVPYDGENLANCW